MIAKSGAVAAIVRLTMFGGCWWFWQCSDSGLWGNDEFARYAQRSDRMTTSSGDAKEVNAMAHIPTPWPRGVNDKRIVADSEHMQHVLEWYRRSARHPDPMPEVSLPDSPMGERIPPEKQGGAGAGGGAGAATPAPYQAQ